MKETLRFVLAMLRIGLIGFGGGSALIPVIEKEAVEKERLIEKDDYEKQVVVASITPGALPVELAGGIGWRRYKTAGMLAGASAMALPGAIGTLFCLAVLGGYNGPMEKQFGYITLGVVTFILLLLGEYVLGVLRQAKQNGNLKKVRLVTAAIFLLTGGQKAAALLGLGNYLPIRLSTLQIFALLFFAVFFTRGEFTKKNWSILLLVGGLYILCAGKNAVLDVPALTCLVESAMLLLGLYGFWKGKKTSAKLPLKKTLKKSARLLLAGAALLAISEFLFPKTASFALRSILSSLMSFGGGDAYLTIADALFVETGGLESAAFYETIVPVVNLLPGSILCKTLTGIGYTLGEEQGPIAALFWAMLGFFCSVSASCGVFLGALKAYERLEDLVFLQVLRRWTQPVIAGLMLNVGVSLIAANLKTGKSAGLSYEQLLLLAAMGVVLYYLTQRRYAMGRYITVGATALAALFIGNLTN